MIIREKLSFSNIIIINPHCNYLYVNTTYDHTREITFSNIIIISPQCNYLYVNTTYNLYM